MEEKLTTQRDSPVYPYNELSETDQILFQFHGLTKREYFAALVLQGFAANSNSLMFESSTIRQAEIAVNYADALINALNKTAE